MMNWRSDHDDHDLDLGDDDHDPHREHAVGDDVGDRSYDELEIGDDDDDDDNDDDDLDDDEDDDGGDSALSP